MAITIPDRTQIRLVTDFDEPNNGQALPACLVSVAMVNPGPVALDTAGAAANGQAQVKPAYGTAGRAGYIGYNDEPNKALGSACSPCRGVLVDGYAGVSPGVKVFIGDTSADASATASGLTHTQPTTGLVTTADTEVNAGTISGTATVNIEVPDGATALSELDITVTTTVATDDTNFWTPTCVNLGTGGAGSTAMLATTDANTNKVTGGSAITANIPRALTLHATPANLAVVGGQFLALTFTKTASAANLVGLVVRASFTGSSSGAAGVGVGWTTTKIFFF
jgi:hypothetical protein